MKINRWLASLAVTLPWAISVSAAPGQTIDPEKLPKVSCTSLTYNHDFLALYPRAPAACQEARIYQGKKYAKFTGKVFLTDPAFITVNLFNVAGDTIETVSLKPNPDAILMVNGQQEHFSELRVGDPVTFWVSEARFSFYGSPGATAPAEGMAPHK
jgi:hypothetical protein